MSFSDITIVPVRTDRRLAYRDFSERMAAVYRDHGALRVLDCWQSADASDAEDFHAQGAMEGYAETGLPDLRRLAGARADETVVVSIIEWPSRAIRDAGVAAVAVDPRVTATLDEDPVFDGARVIGAGFDVLLDHR